MKWRLGDPVPKGWKIPEGISHNIDLGLVIRLARKGKTEKARWLLERYKQLRYEGVELEPVYQKGWGGEDE